MSADILCHRKDWGRIAGDEVRAILQPFIADPLPENLSRRFLCCLTTGEPFGVWVKPEYIGILLRDRTPGIDAVLRALADAGFLLHYSEGDEYIDPYKDE